MDLPGDEAAIERIVSSAQSRASGGEQEPAAGAVPGKDGTDRGGGAAVETHSAEPAAPAGEAPKAEAKPEEKAEEKTEEKAPDEEEPPAPEKKDPLAPKFAALQRKLASVVLREQALNQREKAIEEREKSGGGAAAELAELKRLAKEDPNAIVEKLGIDFKDLVRRRVGIGAPAAPAANDEVKKLQERLDRQEAEAKAEKARLEQERQEKERQEQIAAARAELNGRIKATITAKTDDEFELLAMEGDEGVERVRTILRLHAEKTGGEIMDIEEAAARAEAVLLKQARQRSAAKKLQQGANGSSTAPSPGAAQQAASKAPAKGHKTPSLNGATPSTIPNGTPKRITVGMVNEDEDALERAAERYRQLAAQRK